MLVDNNALKLVLAGSLAIFLILKITEPFAEEEDEESYSDLGEDVAAEDDDGDDDEEAYAEDEEADDDDDEAGDDEDTFAPFNENDDAARVGTIVRSEGKLQNAVRAAHAPGPMPVSVNALPKPAPQPAWSEFAPDPAVLTGQNFVDSSRWVGMSTMSNRRNANRQLRADPPIAKDNSISPWMQSSIEQDMYRRPLE
jgi:hypothetical protein